MTFISYVFLKSLLYEYPIFRSFEDNVEKSVYKGSAKSVNAQMKCKLF